MASDTNYSIHLDVKCPPLTRIDIQEINKACQEKWWNQTLTKINDSVLRIGIVQGEFHWHKHDNEDELFYVVEGRLFLDLEDRTIELAPQQAFMVPKGVVHRPRAPERTVMLMIEGAGVVPTGD
jgi:mannose-6-phosphate isomerase-like protein (cupin superfamily)